LRNQTLSDDKVRAAFRLYDTDGNGFIDPSEMEHYLLSVYKVTFSTHPEAVAGLGPKMTPEKLARATTRQIFKDVDVNGDGQLSFEEFREWYSAQVRIYFTHLPLLPCGTTECMVSRLI
jgi:Ca2+-binding EF-hand superfamily protein